MALLCACFLRPQPVLTHEADTYITFTCLKVVKPEITWSRAKISQRQSTANMPFDSLRLGKEPAALQKCGTRGMTLLFHSTIMAAVWTLSS